MNNTDISLEQETYDVVDDIEFGMKSYAQHWKGFTNATNDEHLAVLKDILKNSKAHNNEFCIVVTSEYKMSIAVYNDEKQCYRIAADLIAFDKSFPTNIVWKKFKFINDFDSWKHNKNGSYKSIRGIKAKYIDIADKEVIALIGDENKILEMENIYCKKGDCKK